MQTFKRFVEVHGIYPPSPLKRFIKIIQDLNGPLEELKQDTHKINTGNPYNLQSIINNYLQAYQQIEKLGSNDADMHQFFPRELWQINNLLSSGSGINAKELESLASTAYNKLNDKNLIPQIQKKLEYLNQRVRDIESGNIKGWRTEGGY